MENKIFNEIIVNSCVLEKRIAILEDHNLTELYTEKVDKQIITGNIYIGTIKNVLPGLGAAFLDIGLDRTAFLHFKDIDFNFLEKKIEGHYNSSQIGKILKPGQEIVVQVKKGPIGKKGARVTGSLTIPGKFLVYMPFQQKVAISKKISSQTERKRIHSIFDKIKEPSVGIIVRTDTEGHSEEDFLQEYQSLEKTWKLLQKQIKYAKVPDCIFEENDLSSKLVRDLFNSNVDRLVLDDKKLFNKIIFKLKEINPDLISRIEFYDEDSPIFDAYGVEKEISKIFQSRIYLPSGGNITIEHTEALIAIDVNTGSFTSAKNYQQTIKQTNLEAAYEIARQIRLRDLSGIIILDFIDMNIAKHRDEVFQLLKSNLKRDREKNKVYPFTHLGLVQISRKRARPSLMIVHSESCPYCNGVGRILTKDSVVILINRWIHRARFFMQNETLKIYVHPSVKVFLDNNPKSLTSDTVPFEVFADSTIGIDKFKIFSAITSKELTEKYNT
ncbi:MAG: Rne/Rng family ribonuclease [Candidatus Cloacimonetes bacterium]|nr:Rne/Rng family ribonuclease [Candidatus Cloacimonadota bacterium]